MRLIIAACMPILASLALVGCGGGDDVSQNPLATAPDTAPTATATISGTPATSTTVGGLYNFTPMASDSDGGAVTFSIANAPSWAAFNSATGQLSGSPKSTDVGTTSGIVITVADGSAKASLPAFSITVSSTTASTPTTGTATLSWVAPTQNSNGSSLTNLAGYNIYYGTNASSLTQTIQVANPATLSYVVTGLAKGTTWYFKVTSYSSAGEESVPSAATSKTI